MYSLISIAVILLACNVNLSHQGDPRIVGGFLATLNLFPHQVSIRTKSSNFHFCGGSIIKNNTILTAAHCMFDGNKQRSAGDLKVIIGDLYTSNNPAAQNTYTVKKITVHKQYKTTSVDKDIALLQLNGAIPPSHASARPINLASYAMPVNSTCHVSGWGTTYEGAAVGSSYLLYTDVPIVNYAACRNVYPTDLKAGMICAGHSKGGKDSCQGDSGGPLTCSGVLAGVVSFGAGCARPNIPGVYTDVLYYKQWINENSGSNLSAGIMTFAVVIFTIINNYKF